MYGSGHRWVAFGKTRPAHGAGEQLGICATKPAVAVAAPELSGSRRRRALTTNEEAAAAATTTSSGGVDLDDDSAEVDEDDDSESYDLDED